MRQISKQTSRAQVMQHAADLTPLEIQLTTATEPRNLQCGCLSLGDDL
jgi:hypothetical protein